MHHEPVALNVAEIKARAVAIAEKMKTLGDAPLPAALRTDLVEVRSALFQRGIYDPVLGRLDSATVPQATPKELAEELVALSASLL